MNESGGLKDQNDKHLACRLCLVQHSNLIAFQNNFDISQKILFHLHLKIEIIPGVPLKLCDSCFKAIDDFNHFFHKINNIHNSINTKEDAYEFKDTLENEEHDENNLLIEIRNNSPLNLIEENFINNGKNNTEQIPILPLPVIFAMPNNLDTSNQDPIESIKLETNNSNKNPENLNAKIPKIISEDGLLCIRGKNLFKLIRNFYKLKCEICMKELSDLRSLKEIFKHYSSKHNIPGYLSCCNLKLTKYNTIIIHLAQHLQPEAFQCDICGHIVSRPGSLPSHKQTHLPEDQKPYKCTECPRRFCWKGALKVHIKTHLPENERYYICQTCGRTYETPGGLSFHKKSHLPEKKPKSNICHICAKNFATGTGLKEHILTIHQPREKDQVQCPICNKWLMQKRCLKSHMLLHSDELLKCNQCDYTTKKKVLLERHHITHHTKETPFKCSECDKKFKFKRALKVHEEKHRKTKSHKCEFCGRVFANSTNFYTHRKNIHPIELEAKKNQALEEKRMKRIEAGIEIPNNVDYINCN